MKVDKKDIEKVLAIFDKEDIPYIDFNYLTDNKIIEIDDKDETKGRVLKLGDKDDG